MSTAAAGTFKPEGDTLAGAQRSAVTVFAIRVGGAALAYGTQVLLARVMGTAGYGIFATAWVWIVMLGHISLFGMAQSVCRFLPYHRVRGELDLARGFLAGGAVIVLATSASVAVIGGALLWFGRGRLDQAAVAPLAVALAVLPVFAMQDYIEGIARSFNWTALAIAPPFIVRQGLIAVAMLAAIGLGAPNDPAVAVACTLFATAAALLIQTVLLLYRLRRKLPRGPRAYQFRTWATATLPMGFVDLTLSGFGFIDVLLLGFLAPPEAVGIYFAATRVLQIVLFAQYAATAATAPRFAEFWTRGDQTTLRALIRTTVRLTSLASLGLGVVLLLSAPLLLALFGPGFDASFNALAVLTLGVVIASAFGPGEDLLNMLGAERACAAVSFIALVLAVILNLVLIPPFGVMGAAVATALATAARGFGMSLAARLRLGLDTHLMA